MRIALITPGFSATEDDWCIPVLLDHVRRLAARHDVHVFTLRYPHHRRRYTVHGATVHALGGATAGGLARLPLLARALRTILGVARQAPFDLYHGFWADEPGALAALAGRLSGAPAIVSLMGGELVALPGGYGGLHSRANRALVRLALGRADQVLAGSSYLGRLAAGYVPTDRMRLLPLGVDSALFTPGPADPHLLPGGAFKLLQVASLLPVKHHLTSLRALHLLRTAYPQVHLHLVGAGPLRADLEQAAAALDIAGQVSFHGVAAHHAMPAYYRSADLCLLSSRHEAQALVTLEAAACERATVGTAVGLLPDLAPWARCVPVGDAAGLAEAIAALIDDPAALAAAGAAIGAQVRTRHSLDHSVAALEECYRAALRRPRQARSVQ